MPRAVGAAMTKADHRPYPNGIEQGHEGGRRVERRQRPSLGGPGRAQLRQRVSTARIAKVHAGDGELQGRLFIGGQVEVRQIEGLGVDPVSVLLGTLDRLGHERDPLFSKQPFVAFERLTAGVAARRVPRHIYGELRQRQRPVCVEKHQDEVGQAFQAVEGHRGQRRTRDT